MRLAIAKMQATASHQYITSSSLLVQHLQSSSQNLGLIQIFTYKRKVTTVVVKVKKMVLEIIKMFAWDSGFTKFDLTPCGGCNVGVLAGSMNAGKKYDFRLRNEVKVKLKETDLPHDMKSPCQRFRQTWCSHRKHTHLNRSEQLENA